MPALRSMLEVATTRATSSSGAEPASGSREAGMDVFEIGREIQDLRGRIERMEADVHRARERPHAHPIGSPARPSEADVLRGNPLVHCNHHVSQIPNALLGLSLRVKLGPVDSTMRSCVLEPLSYPSNTTPAGPRVRYGRVG